MRVHVVNQQEDLVIDEEQVRKIADHVISAEGKKTDEVGIHFIDDPTMRRLHEEFFHDSSSTDCISFPMDALEEEPYSVLGDVFVCPATALAYSQQHNTLPLEEVTLYIVHGLLHLMGYDDIDPIDEAEMRKAEKKHMNLLQKSNLVLYTESKR